MCDGNHATLCKEFGFDVFLRKAKHAYATTTPSAPYTAALMGASRKKIPTGDGSIVILTK